MSYEIFLTGADDGDLAPQSAVLPYLERLPGWTWEAAGAARFYWPEYGPQAQEVVYGADRDRIRWLTFERPSERTIELGFVLADIFGGEVSDPEGALEDEYGSDRYVPELSEDEEAVAGEPSAFDALLWDARVAPLALGSGWAQVSGHFLLQREGVSVEPASEQEIADAEQRLGVRLPELLREWYLGIGELGYVPALDELRLDGGELVLADDARYATTSDTVTANGLESSSLRDLVRDHALWEF